MSIAFLICLYLPSWPFSLSLSLLCFWWRPAQMYSIFSSGMSCEVHPELFLLLNAIWKRKDALVQAIHCTVWSIYFLFSFGISFWICFCKILHILRAIMWAKITGFFFFRGTSTWQQSYKKMKFLKSLAYRKQHCQNDPCSQGSMKTT